MDSRTSLETGNNTTWWGWRDASDEEVFFLSFFLIEGWDKRLQGAYLAGYMARTQVYPR